MRLFSILERSVQDREYDDFCLLIWASSEDEAKRVGWEYYEGSHIRREEGCCALFAEETGRVDSSITCARPETSPEIWRSLGGGFDREIRCYECLLAPMGMEKYEVKKRKHSDDYLCIDCYSEQREVALIYQVANFLGNLKTMQDTQGVGKALRMAYCALDDILHSGDLDHYKMILQHATEHGRGLSITLIVGMFRVGCCEKYNIPEWCEYLSSVEELLRDAGLDVKSITCGLRKLHKEHNKPFLCPCLVDDCKTGLDAEEFLAELYK